MLSLKLKTHEIDIKNSALNFISIGIFNQRFHVTLKNNYIHMKLRYNYFLLIALIPLLLLGCEEYLDVKPDKALVVPSELKDFQALLDNDWQMMNQDVALTFMGADNYYIPGEAWPSLNTSTERNSYIWAEEIYEGRAVADWNIPYEQVFIANVVLDGLESLEVKGSESVERDQIQGSALFFRAYAFFNLLQVFAPPYDPATAEEKLGIPLRLEVDMKAPVYRSALQVCYDEVVNSLREASGLLTNQTAHKTRPNKAAAYGLLARVYLSMHDYGQAERYADSCLNLGSALMDYNMLDTTAENPFPQYNEEVIFHSVLLSYSVIRMAYVDQGLYAFYVPGDLRKQLFFEAEEETGNIIFSGSYTTQSQSFSGIATDEIYLIRAECRARLGDTEGAMDDLNTLLESRWETGSFLPLTAANSEAALEIILRERRKELLFRGLRWMDLRRLNQDPRFAKTLERTLNGETFTLPPNDPRYVYPIPEQEIDVSGIEQNPR